MVKRAMIGQEDKDLVAKLFEMGFNALNNNSEKANYQKFIYSAECAKSVKALGRYLKFSFVKPLTGITREDVGNEVFKTTLENRDFHAPYENSVNTNSILLNKLFVGFNDYASENTISSLMNNKYGSIQILLSVDKEMCLNDGIDLKGDWDLKYVYQPLIGYFLPYWLNTVSHNQFIVNHESKPGITVEDMAVIFLEMGMSYDMDSPDSLFKEAMSYVMIDDVEGFQNTVRKEWVRGNNLLCALEKDDVLMLSSLLSANPGDLRMDFPQCNSLISLAVKLQAENCLDVLLMKGASLWRSVGALDNSLSVDGDRSVFSALITTTPLPSFASYVFFMEYMKKEVISERENKREIVALQDKVKLIIHHLSLENRWDKVFFNRYVIDFVYSVLEDNRAHECIVDNYFDMTELSPDFKIAVQNISQKSLAKLIEKNFKNLLFLYRVTSHRSLPSNMIIKGRKIKDLVSESYNMEIPMIKSIYESFR